MTPYELGERAFHERNLADAYAHFQAATDSVDDPTRQKALFQAGRVADLIGQPEAALDYFDRYLALDPTSQEVTFMRGTVRLLLGDFDRGWQDYQSYYETRKYSLRPHPFPLWDGR